MDPGFPCHFPNGSFFKKREGLLVHLLSTKVIKERFSSFSSDYTVSFEGKAMTSHNDAKNGQHAVLKLIYQMWPGHHHEEGYWPSLYRLTSNKFIHQCKALKALGPTGYFPEYVASEETKQSDDGPYPDGSLFMLVMTKLEGAKFRYAPTKGDLVLDRNDMQFIKREILNAHEYSVLPFYLKNTYAKAHIQPSAREDGL